MLRFLKNKYAAVIYNTSVSFAHDKIENRVYLAISLHICAGIGYQSKNKINFSGIDKHSCVLVVCNEKMLTIFTKIWSSHFATLAK